MALAHSPSLVLPGLVLCLDAANPKSYPGSGTTWTDLSGNGNNGTLVNGVGFDSGNLGSLSFDGVNDYVSFNSFNFGNEMTLMCFVRPSLTNQIQTIFSNSVGGGQVDGTRFIINNFNLNTRNIIISVGNGTSGGSVPTTVVDKIIYDSWQHLTYVANKNTNNAKIYYNGVLQLSATPQVNDYNTNAAFRLGLYRDNQFPLNGRISNYLIYTRELTPQEIQQNFNATRRRFSI